MSDSLVHPSAVIEPGARLGNDVRVGAFSYIGADVEIGDGTSIGPHCSLAEARTLATFMRGRHAAPGTEVFITTSRAVRELLHRSGELAVLEAFGARVTADTCIVVAPLVNPEARVLMTNSAKYAHYGPGLLGVDAVFGATEECVESAVAGTIVRRGSPWEH